MEHRISDHVVGGSGRAAAAVNEAAVIGAMRHLTVGEMYLTLAQASDGLGGVSLHALQRTLTSLVVASATERQRAWRLLPTADVITSVVAFAERVFGLLRSYQRLVAADPVPVATDADLSPRMRRVMDAGVGFRMLACLLSVFCGGERLERIRVPFVLFGEGGGECGGEGESLSRELCGHAAGRNCAA
jgi:hypothetical protein